MMIHAVGLAAAAVLFSGPCVSCERIVSATVKARHNVARDEAALIQNESKKVHESQSKQHIHVAALQMDSSVKMNTSRTKVIPPEKLRTVLHQKEKKGGYLSGSPLYTKQQEGKNYSIAPATAKIVFEARTAASGQSAVSSPGFWVSAVILILGIVGLVGVAAWNHNSAKATAQNAKPMSPQSMRSAPSMRQSLPNQSMSPQPQYAMPQSGMPMDQGGYMAQGTPVQTQAYSMPPMNNGMNMNQQYVSTSPMSSQQRLMAQSMPPQRLIQ